MCLRDYFLSGLLTSPRNDDIEAVLAVSFSSSWTLLSEGRERGKERERGTERGREREEQRGRERERGTERERERITVRENENERK